MYTLPINRVNGVDIKNFNQVDTLGLNGGSVSAQYGNIEVRCTNKTGKYSVTAPVNGPLGSAPTTFNNLSFVNEDDNSLQLSDNTSTYIIDKVNQTLTIQ